MRLLLLLPLGFFALAMAGCPGPNLDTEPRVIPGTGEVEFVTLTSGVDDLVLTNGVQGGTHVWGAARAIGMDWRDLTVSWTLTDEEGEEVSEPTTIRQSLQPCAQAEAGCLAGMGEIVAVTVILESASSVRGDELTLTVEAFDDEGREAMATSSVRPISQVVVD